MITTKEKRGVLLGLSITKESEQNQQNEAHHVLKEMLGANSTMCYQKTGRPFLPNSPWDISLSHKKGVVFVGAIPKSYRVGVDIEYDEGIANLEIFCKHILCDGERKRFPFFCRDLSVSEETAALIVWTIKESFCKCADLPLIPRQIEVWWSKKDGILVKVGEVFQEKLQKKRLVVQEVFFEMSDGLVRAVTVMS